jgi:hypothetical protein
MTAEEEALTPEQLRPLYAALDVAIKAWYRSASNITVHPAIEFAALMSKWLEVYRRAGTYQSSKHYGKAAPLHGGDLLYIVEKLDCIFGPALKASDPEVRAMFVRGVEAMVKE